MKAARIVCIIKIRNSMIHHFGNRNLIQAVYIKNRSLCMTSIISSFSGRKNFDFKRTVFRIYASKPHVIILTGALQRTQAIVNVYRIMVLVFYKLFNEGSNIIRMEGHPGTSILNTRHRTLIRFPLQHTTGTGFSFTRNPFPSCSSSNCCN